jgi:transposase
MAARYSEDLRRKIVQAYEPGTRSQREVAELFHVSLSFVEALLQYYRRSGGELVPPVANGDRLCWLTMPVVRSYGSGSKHRPT